MLLISAIAPDLAAQRTVQRNGNPAVDVGDLIWRGKIGDGREVVWGTEDLTVSSAGAPSYSCQKQTENAFSHQMTSWYGQPTREVECHFERSATLLSVTDRYLGMRLVEERACTG